MQILRPSSAAIKRHVWPIGLLTPGLNLDLAPSTCCLLRPWLANFTEQGQGNVYLEGLVRLFDSNTAISHAPKPSRHMLLESKLGPAARRLRELSCGAQMSHVTQRRDRPRVYLYILCSWVYQHVSLCPKLNRFWLTGERAWSCRRRGRSRDCPLSSLLSQQCKHARSRGQWGWASPHYPVASFSIQLKVPGDQNTTAFRRNEFWCLRSLLFIFVVVVSPLFIPHCIFSTPTGCQSSWQHSVDPPPPLRFRRLHLSSAHVEAFSLAWATYTWQLNNSTHQCWKVQAWPRTHNNLLANVTAII